MIPTPYVRLVRSKKKPKKVSCSPGHLAITLPRLTRILSLRTPLSRHPAKMAARPTVTVYAASGEASGSLALPSVFTAPIRLDVVQQVHSECRSAGIGRGKRGDRGGFRGHQRNDDEDDGDLEWIMVRAGEPDKREMKLDVQGTIGRAGRCLATLAWFAEPHQDKTISRSSRQTTYQDTPRNPPQPRPLPVPKSPPPPLSNLSN